jgi:2-oxo-4-hydroxy-4-carboxy-5-ureidoimidazoline decarboxylase
MLMNMTDFTIDRAAINSVDKAAFVRELGSVFEHTPWIAECAFEARPFTSVDSLHEAMVQAVKQRTPEEQLGLLRAHPELAGKEAQKGTMTSTSTEEQAEAGLTALTHMEMERIAQLNRDYRAKFGFPFIIAARRHSKAGIFAEFERRLNNEAATELANALAQVFIIARLRLDAMFAQQ